MSKNIHEAILEVMGKVGYVQKQRGKNLNYSYAGEAALIAALRPEMIECGIYSHVTDISYERSSYQTSKGTTMNTTVVRGSMRFTHAASDTSVDSFAIGEGADVGDKSASKAMTGFLKYALRQTFLIETGDDPDKYPSEEMEQSQLNWTAEQQGWLVAANYAENVFSAKAMLEKSNLPKNSGQVVIESWGKYYRASRDDDNTSDVAAMAANGKYTAAIKKANK